MIRIADIISGSPEEDKSKKKKAEFDGQPHTQTPDIDNLCKAILDALYQSDSGIHEIALKKVWSRNGFILFEVENEN